MIQTGQQLTVEEQRVWAASVRRRRRRHRELIRAASVASSLAAIAALSACEHGNSAVRADGYTPLPSPTGTEQAVAANNFGRLWPVSVASGTLACRADDATVFLTRGGRSYALNGRAREHGYADIAEIRDDDVSLGALRSEALKLCR